MSFKDATFTGADRIIATVTLLVTGTVVVDLGSFTAVDLSIPLVVAVDLGTGEVREWRGYTANVEGAIR